MVKASKTSYGKSSEKLNWDAIVSKKGETRVEHIKRHTVQNNSRETHSVFNGNPIDMVNDAWEQRHLVEPISDGMGGTIYNIVKDKLTKKCLYVVMNAKQSGIIQRMH